MRCWPSSIARWRSLARRSRSAWDLAKRSANLREKVSEKIREKGTLADVQERTAQGQALQIVTKFAEQAVLRPPLVEGDTLWDAGPTKGHLYLHPADILVRLGEF